jgi:hypothetical protein
MTPTQELQERIRRYLLGQLSDGAGEEMERDLLANEEVFAELLIIEDELTDEYVDGRLSPDDRANFERYFLATPERQEDLRFARALNRYVETDKNTRRIIAAAVKPNSGYAQSFWFRVIAAVALVAILIGVYWIIPRRPLSQQNFAILTLTISASNRGEGTPAATMKLPRDADGLKLFLQLPAQEVPAARYRVELEHEGGARNTLEATAQDAHSITVVIAASVLKQGLNSLKVFAINADGKEQRIPGTYFFNIE